MAGMLDGYSRQLVTGYILTLILCKGSESGNTGHVAVIRTGSHVAQRLQVSLRTVLAHVAVENRCCMENS